MRETSVVDSLGLGITCVLYHCTMCTRHPDLVSFAFCAIPIFHYNLKNFLFTCIHVHVNATQHKQKLLFSEAYEGTAEVESEYQAAQQTGGQTENYHLPGEHVHRQAPLSVGWAPLQEAAQN